MNGFKNDPNKRVTEYGAKNRKEEDGARRTSANHAAISEGLADAADEKFAPWQWRAARRAAEKVQVGVYSLQPMDADRVARQRAAIDLAIMAREEIEKATARCKAAVAVPSDGRSVVARRAEEIEKATMRKQAVIAAREEAIFAPIAARFSCRDCGEGGEVTGHMGCQYPGDNS